MFFQPVHAHSGPWKETKGCQGQARLEKEGHVIDQTLPGCSCKEGMLGGSGEVEGGGISAATHTLRGICTLKTDRTHKESLWHLVRVGTGKYLPSGIITVPLAARPRWETQFIAFTQMMADVTLLNREPSPQNAELPQSV